jgi:hypothetical protein
MQWIVVSGFLLASGSAYAGDASPTRGDDAGRPHLVAQAMPPAKSGKVDVTHTDQGPQSSARSSGYNVSTVQSDTVDQK